MKVASLSGIIVAFLMQNAAAQTLKITYSPSNAPVTKLMFPSSSSSFPIKVDSPSPIKFEAFATRGTTMDGDWMKIALVDQATPSCPSFFNVPKSPVVDYKTYPTHLTATTPAYLCVADGSDRFTWAGEYPAFLNFTVSGKLAARVPAEAKLATSGYNYLQIGTPTQDGILEGSTFTFIVPGAVPPAQSLVAKVESNAGIGSNNTVYNGVKIVYSAYDFDANPINWVIVQSFDASGAATQNAVSPALFKVSIDPSKVPPGITDLQGYVQFLSSTDNSNRAYPGESFILVSATITPPPPALSVADSLAVNLTWPGGPLQQGVRLTTNGVSIPFTATVTSADGTGWLQVSPAGGNAPATLTVIATVNSSRTPGTYPGVLTVTPTDSRITPLNIPVILAVTRPAPTLVFTPASVNLSCNTGGRADDQTIAVAASDSSRVDFNYRLDSIPGVSIDGSAGSTAATVTLHGNCQSVTAGTYRGNVTFAETPPNAAVPTQTVPIALTVTAGLTLSADPGSLQFTFVQGGAVPAGRSVNLSLGNGSAAPVTLKPATQSGGNWLLAPATGTTGQPVNISVNTDGLQPGTYTGQIAISSSSAVNQLQIAVQLIVTASNQPVITSVTSSATGLAEIAPGSFFSVYGANFVGASLTWENFIVNGLLPTEIQSVQVKVNNQNAYIYFVSDKQINAIVPATSGAGTVQVQVVTPNGPASAGILMKQYSPAIFPQYVAGKAYATALIFGESTTTLAGPPGAMLAYKVRPARPGDILSLYATGLGSTSPAYPDGKVLDPATIYSLGDPSPLKITIGGVAVDAIYAGLASPGLYQINLKVPEGVVDGDQPITLGIGGETSPATTYLAVQQ